MRSLTSPSKWLIAGLALTCLISARAQNPGEFRLLVFSKTAGFRHESIEDGLAAIRDLARSNFFSITATEDGAQFNDTNLAQYSAVVFLCTTGDVLDGPQQMAFERYIRRGGGFVGIHSASDTEHTWPWYGELVGAYFSNHPPIQQATVEVLDRVHPSTKGLPQRWARRDEWYNFARNPRGRVHVLASLNEKSYSGGAMGVDHPIAWAHENYHGRAWYTGGGHTRESYSEPLFRQHLLGGILWAARIQDADRGPTIDVNFRRLVLDPVVTNPVQLAVSPDGRVFFTEKAGKLKMYDPRNRATKVAAELATFSGNEDGLLGVALDPGFSTNNWIYLYYSPAGINEQHLARFTLRDSLLDLNSRQVLLKIPTQREICCHSAGSLAFGPDGDLYLSTGDNTDPFASNGFAPIDERAGRAGWDAQRSSANVNDLRGKVLRIRPTVDGSYDIPNGNLFPKDGSAGRPEIFVMGCRNPFTISVDRRNGWLYWGDVGPDAEVASLLRGSEGCDEINQARSAGNYGWPYFVANNRPYVDYDFSTAISGSPFDPGGPVNNSPNNTGTVSLPPARPAWIWYPYYQSVDFPQIKAGRGRSVMAGPVYHYDATLAGAGKLPAYYDETLLIYDFSLNWLAEVKLDSGGDILSIEPFLANLPFVHPVDLELGPDGTLFMLEYGNRHDKGSIDGRLVQILYRPSKFVLQSSSSVTGEFQDEPAAFNETEGSFTIEEPQTPRFYRARGAIPSQITGVTIAGSALKVAVQ